MKDDCPQRLVPCDNLPRGCCVAALSAAELPVHLAHMCKFRDVECRVGCGRKLMHFERHTHEVERCPLRSVPCRLGCGLSLPARDGHKHYARECAKRIVKCRVGCGQEMPFEALDAHERDVCVQPCKWEGCGLEIGPEDRRALHEGHLCPRRVVVCPDQCGTAGIQAERLAVHRAAMCPRRKAACRNGCGALVAHGDVRLHEDTEKGSCTERLMRCRYDLVGRRVEIAVYSTDPFTAERVVKFERATILLFDPDRESATDAADAVPLFEEGSPKVRSQRWRTWHIRRWHLHHQE
jgi:hypothetical protein